MSLIKKNEKRRILEIYSPKSSDEKIIQKINLKQIKITKKKNKSFEKIDFNNEIDSNKATCSFTSEENGFSFFQTVNIKLFYYINEQIKNIEIIINENNTIFDFIRFSINLINENLKQENFGFKLNNKNIEKYQIKIAKKNGMPNFDYPSFNKNTIIKNCKSEKLCLIWIENENNYLIKNNENDNIKNIYNKKIKKNKKNEIKKFTYKKDFNNNNNNNNLNYDEICILF
jgi:hypothetical protein